MASDVTNTSVRFLTGGDVVIGDLAGTIRGQAQKSLFILLALNSGRPVSRDRIAATLWPDADPKAGRANLRTALLALKRALRSFGGPEIDANNEAITLVGATVDLNIFEHLAASSAPEDWWRALHLYRGDFCPDQHVPSEEFNSLLEIEREKWRNVAVMVAERLIASIDACERPDAAIEAAQALLTIDPAHEPTHRLLMRVFSKKGDRGMALRQFEQFRAVLLEAYDLQPSAETLALRDEIAQKASHDGVLDLVTPDAEVATIAPKVKSKPDPPTSRQFSRRSAGLTAGAVLAAIAVVLYLFDGPDSAPSNSVNESAAAPILAVEPFSYDATDPDLTEFVDSLRTELLVDLASEGRALVTIADSPAWRSLDIASEFHLRGSVQRIGTSVKTSAQLVSVRDQTVIWAEAEIVRLDAAETISHSIAREALDALRDMRSQ